MAKKKTAKKSKPKLKKQRKNKVQTVDELKLNGEKEKTDVYKEHACEYLNEAECEEELDEDGLDLNEVEKSHFKEDDK